MLCIVVVHVAAMNYIRTLGPFSVGIIQCSVQFSVGVLMLQKQNLKPTPSLVTIVYRVLLRGVW